VAEFLGVSPVYLAKVMQALAGEDIVEPRRDGRAVVGNRPQRQSAKHASVRARAVRTNPTRWPAEVSAFSEA
jgi:DNA-binding FadR family transcriptional regulator